VLCAGEVHTFPGTLRFNGSAPRAVYSVTVIDYTCRVFLTIPVPFWTVRRLHCRFPFGIPPAYYPLTAGIPSGKRQSGNRRKSSFWIQGQFAGSELGVQFQFSGFVRYERVFQEGAGDLSNWDVVLACDLRNLGL